MNMKLLKTLAIDYNGLLLSVYEYPCKHCIMYHENKGCKLAGEDYFPKNEIKCIKKIIKSVLSKE